MVIPGRHVATGRDFVSIVARRATSLQFVRPEGASDRDESNVDPCSEDSVDRRLYASKVPFP